MIFKEMILENFRQFEGKHVISFSTDVQKNITVILGDNTFGKTTILQAILWCLYGEASFSNETRDPKIISLGVLKDHDETSSVQITLSHQGNNYVIKRQIKYFANGSHAVPSVTILKPQDDGNSKVIDDPESAKIEISKILPKSLSPYFFYDAERIFKMADRKELAEAVKQILGLVPLANARDDIGDPDKPKKNTVITRLKERMYQDSSDNTIDALRKRRNELQEKIDVAERDIDERKKNIEKIDKNRESIKQIISENKDSQAIQKDLKYFEQDKDETEKNLVKETAVFMKDFNQELYNFVFFKLYKILKERIISARSEFGDTIPGVVKSTIEAILDDRKCICGCKIEEGSSSEKVLRKLLQTVSDISPQTHINSYKDRINNYSENGEKYLSRFELSRNTILDLESKLYDLSPKIDKLKAELKETIEIKPYLDQLDEYSRQINDDNKEIEQDKLDISKNQSEIRNIDDETLTLTNKSKTNDLLKEYIAYASAAYKWLDENYKDKEKKMLSDLNDTVKRVFKDMYTGSDNRFIEIKDDFTIKTYITGNPNVNDDISSSEGLQKVINYAFAGSVFILAGKNSLPKNTNDPLSMIKDNNEFPLVIDAPFSELDEKHIEKVSKVLPNVANQLIIFVMKKDWDFAKDIMKDKLSKLYELEKISEISSRIIAKEV